MRLKLWINSFIPGHIQGYTKTLARGLHAGKTAISLPGGAYITNPQKLLSTVGYLTDQRSFDHNPDIRIATVRMQTMIELLLAPSVQLVKRSHLTSGTVEVDIETGEQLGFALADMSDCEFGPLIKEPIIPMPPPLRLNLSGLGDNVLSRSEFHDNDKIDESYSIGFTAAASDPLVNLAADIDYEGNFNISFRKSPMLCSVGFSGAIDAFPAFECYAQLNQVSKTIFRFNPPKGNTVLNLPFGANRRVWGFADFSEDEPCYVPGTLATKHLPF